MAKNKYSIKCGDVILVPVKPEQENYTKWDIKWEAYEKKEEKRKVATVFFCSAPENGTVSIDFTVEEGFKFHAYTKDAVMAIKEWALDQNGIYEVTCDTFKEDEVKVDAIQRAGLIYRNVNQGIEHYSADKQRTAWTALYIMIGVFAGMIMGIVFNSMPIGLAMGVIIGIIIGALMDGKANDVRAQVTKHKYIGHRKEKGTGKEREEDKESQED